MAACPGVPALHVHRFGPPDGPPLLVLHGVTSTGPRYRRLAEEELPGARALVAPTCADTATPPGTRRGTCAGTWPTCSRCSTPRASTGWPVAGHSFGGLLAMALAAAAPGAGGAASP